MSCLFDASCIVFPGLKLLYDLGLAKETEQQLRAKAPLPGAHFDATTNLFELALEHPPLP